MSMPSAKIICDSVDEAGHRLTTMEVKIHRFVLSEFNTHRAFSRNSASSRAIPVKKQIERVLTDPALPISWPAEQKGMQGGEELPSLSRDVAIHLWYGARDSTVATVQHLVGLGLHKSVTNRLLEPFMWHTVIVTSETAGYENFFNLRCSSLAQPEIRYAAEQMREAYNLSRPRLLNYGEWHLPYIDRDTFYEAHQVDSHESITNIYMMVSAARCARVSYLTHDGNRDVNEDLAMYERLVSADPMHASPLEHVATPWGGHGLASHLGCFPHFDQLRHRVEGKS
jgi:thymidylate synthase ThyX